ncbi:MAG: F0F1 ATP synthase subunit gamma [Succinivibrionaceae bacterium]|nr:F0F1 ATP synthase subunit gamma [Bacillales bacterium]MDY5780114.1 F0F1 ATP synthase subunit gamma [Succinivibrionaceae bacterium]MEE1339802.1 F0F1 ATP synthase subunit gamma [Succinivibrionaceae bacterium]
MAGAKEIRTKIVSVKSTQKITSAMKMVAASKMRRAQDRMASSRPYAKAMRTLIGHIALGHLEYKHPYTVERPVKNVGYIIISTDRGLCGGLNINLFKNVLLKIKQDKANNIESCVSLLGSKACNFFSRVGIKTLSHASGMGDNPSIDDLIGSVRLMLKAYDNAEIDKLYIVYNKFVNTMVQTPVIEQILPLQEAKNTSVKSEHWDYIYEPDAEVILTTLFKRYIESLVYQGVVENLASEQAARMVAMKAATDNAESLVEDLQLVYNKARQAGITQEITEIVSGAAAV